MGFCLEDTVSDLFPRFPENELRFVAVADKRRGGGDLLYFTEGRKRFFAFLLFEKELFFKAEVAKLAGAARSDAVTIELFHFSRLLI